MLAGGSEALSKTTTDDVERQQGPCSERRQRSRAAGRLRVAIPTVRPFTCEPPEAREASAFAYTSTVRSAVRFHDIPDTRAAQFAPSRARSCW